MGAKRYSNIPSIRRRQEAFDHLQWRCKTDFYAPTIGELRLSDVVEKAHFVCANFTCMHQGASFELTRYWSGLNVRDLKKRHYCGHCKSKKMELRLEYKENNSL